MRDMLTQPRGIITALVTPMSVTGEVNTAELARLIDWQVHEGVHGILVLGSQGESYALSFEEKVLVMEATVEAMAGRIPLYAGTGCVTTNETVRLTKAASRAGVDAVLVMTPSFIQPSEEELYQHYRSVAQATDLPVIVYSNPGRTGVLMPTSLVRRLSGIDNIVGIKDSSGDLTTTATYIQNSRPGFGVLAGRDSLILGTLTYGGVGAVAATGNVVPSILVRLYEDFVSGNMEGARVAQHQILPLRLAFELGTFPSVIKEALNMIGFSVGSCRLPVGPLSDPARARLREVLASLGLCRGDCQLGAE